MPGTKYNQIKGKDPEIETYLAKVSRAESGDNPNARNPNGSATGLWQFIDSTWKNLNEKYGFGYTLEDRKNPEKAANVMRQFTKDNESILRPVLGRDITDADRYMGHFLGAGGARKFFLAYNANPNAPISSVVSPEALKANKNVFYNKDGSLKTLSGVYGWANEKMSTKVKPKVYTPSSQVKTTAYDNRSQYFSPELTSAPVPLQTSTTEYVEPVIEEEPVEVQQAKQEIAEKSFLQDLSSMFSTPPVFEVQQQPDEVAFDPSAYEYINIEEYQDGGSYESDKKWLQDWYGSREIPNEDINNLYLEDKPYYKELSQFIPDPKMVDYIDPNEPRITGRYDRPNASIELTPNASKTAFLHEATHRTQDFLSAMRPIHNNIVTANVYPQDRVEGVYKDKYKYFTDSDEVHARIQVLRNQAGIKPNQTVTPEFIQGFLKTYKGDDSNINDLLNITDEKGLLEMLNYMASVDKKTDNNLV